MSEHSVLQAFARAVDREAHNLVRWPELSWGQLYNRLRWQPPPVPEALEGELSRRTEAGAAPWIRARTPSRESSALMRTLLMHTRPVNACAVSPDGSFLVSGGDDRTLAIWDAATGLVRVTCTGSPTAIEDCAVTPDGRLILSVAKAGIGDEGKASTIRVWDAASGDQRAILGGHEGDVYSCAVAPDGSYAVTGGEDGMLRIWPLATGSRAAAIPLEGRVQGCAIAPDGRFIVAATDKGIGIYDASSRREIRFLRWGAGGITFAPDGSLVCAGDGSLSVWNVATGEQMSSMEVPPGPRRYATAIGVEDCAVDPDGTFAVSANRDGTLTIWDLAAGSRRATLRGHSGTVYSCAICPDGSFVASASLDSTVKIWDAGAVEERHSPGHLDRISSCALSPDGRLVASMGHDLHLRLWDARSGEEVVAIELQPSDLEQCAIAPDGDFVVGESGPYKLSIWEVPSGKARAVLKGHRDWASDFAISPDGSFVVSASNDKTLAVWDAASGERLAGVECHDAGPDVGYGPQACAIAPDGSFIVSSGRDGTVRIWDRSLRELRRIAAHRDDVFDCALAPDASFVVSVGMDGAAKVWDTLSGELMRSLPQRGPAHSCGVSPDGAFILTTGRRLPPRRPDDRQIVVWDTATGEQRAAIEGLAFAVTPDARFLVVCGIDDTLEIWDASEGRRVAATVLLGPSFAVDVHPWLPFVACADSGGSVYLLDLIGIEYGPIMATAVDGRGGPGVRCPRCRETHRVPSERLGSEIDCPTCALRLRVNENVARSLASSTGGRLRRFLRRKG